MSALPTEFKSDYYDYGYFADPKGKEFRKADGTVDCWGYKNPQGEFLGAAAIAKAWKAVFTPKNMLDVGCGRGTFVAYARDEGIEAFGFDYSEWAIEHRYPRCSRDWVCIHNAATMPWAFSIPRFDLVVALDFLEHIYAEDLDFVIEEMLKVASKWIFLQIATVDDVKEKGYSLKRGEPIPLDTDGRTWAGHVNVQTAQYWYDKFDRVGWLPRRDMVNWFCSLVDPRVIANWVKNTIIVLERWE